MAADYELGVFELAREPLDPARIQARVGHPACGACACFTGSTRDENRGKRVVRLEYEAYERMALLALEGLERAACERFQLGHCAVVHRLGLVPVTEASVAVVTSAPHRGAAFDAARWVMDELKRGVTIWKKEYFAEGGAEWVEGHPLAGD